MSRARACRSLERVLCLLPLVIAGSLVTQVPETAPAPDRLPLAFVENRGQWTDAVGFRARSGPATLWFESAASFVIGLDRYELPTEGVAESSAEQGLCFGPRGEHTGSVAFRLRFAGARDVPPVGDVELSGVDNFYVGDDRSRWVTGARRFARLRYAEVYPGVDVVVREHGQRVEYDLEFAPGADLSRAIVRVEGVDELRVAADGSLVMVTALGEVRQTPPVSWVESAGGLRTPVGSRFELVDDDSYRFAVPGWNGTRPLVVDPGLDWGSFVGGAGDDWIFAQDVDDQDRLVVAGHSSSATYPMTLGRFGGGFYDAFVMLLDPTQTGPAQVVWSTWLGGDDLETALDVEATTPQNRITVVGYTYSTNFPLMNPFQGRHRGDRDAFVTQFDLGGALQYSTFLGREFNDRAASVEVDRTTGEVTFAGFTNSPNFPLLNPYQGSLGGGFDMFLCRLRPGAPAQLAFSTFLGGALNEGIAFSSVALNLDLQDLHVAADGTVAIASRTGSLNYPFTPGAYQTAHRGGSGADGCLTIFDPAVQSLRYSTYVGSTADDTILGIDRDAAGVVSFVALTWGADFPVTPGAFQVRHGGVDDGVLGRLDPAGNGAADLLYSTLIAGLGNTEMFDLAVEASGIITAVGATSVPSNLRGTHGAYRERESGQSTGFVVRLDPQGRGQKDLHYLSFVGAGSVTPLSEGLLGISRRSDGSFLMTGGTDNPDNTWTTPGAFQSRFGGGPTDSFVLGSDLLPVHTTRVGSSSPACAGPIYMQVNSDPNRGNLGFELHCNHAPPAAIGVLLIGNRVLPRPILGATIYPTQPFFQLAVHANAVGVARTSLPLPAAMQDGQRFVLQYVWVNRNGCGTPGNLSASSALWISP